MAKYRATFLRLCKGEPSPVQRVLADLGARALLRADAVGPADHATYVRLVNAIAEIICLLPRARLCGGALH